MKNFTGYKFIQGPEQLLLMSGKRVQTSEEYRMWQANLVFIRGGDTWNSTGAVDAIVNHGRWIAICRWCGTGMFTRPDWGVAYCAECGAIYDKGMVRFKNDASKIAELLCLRIKREEQNWDSSQSLAELIDENNLLLGAR